MIPSPDSYGILKSAEGGDQPGNLTVITGEYDVGKIGRGKKGSLDTIELVRSDDPGSVLLQISLQFGVSGNRNGVLLRGSRNTTDGIFWYGDKTKWLTRDELGGMFPGDKGNFTIQIAADRNGYNIAIFAQSTGEAPSSFTTKFNYNSDEIWRGYKHRVGDADLAIINRDDHSISSLMSRMVQFRSVSQCRVTPSSEVPELRSVQVGQTVSLDCSVTGIAHVTSSWTGGGGGGELMSSERRTLTGFVSELVLEDFTVDDVGLYTCRVFVGVLGVVLEKRFDVQLEHYDVEILSSPTHTTFREDDRPTTFTWLFEGNPLDVVVNCSGGHTESTKYQNHWPPRLDITLSIVPESAPNVIYCSITRSDGRIVQNRVFRRVESVQGVSPGWKTGTIVLIVIVLVTILLILVVKVYRCVRSKEQCTTDEEESTEMMQIESE